MWDVLCCVVGLVGDVRAWGIGVGQREIVVCRMAMSDVWGRGDVLCCGAGGCTVLWGFVEDVRAWGICVGQREIVGTFAVWGGRVRDVREQWRGGIVLRYIHSLVDGV